MKLNVGLPSILWLSMKRIGLGCDCRFGQLVLGASLSILLGGCAFSYVDSEGATHVIGLVKLKIESGNSEAQNIADAVEIQSIGISVYSTPVNSGISVGYNRERIIYAADVNLPGLLWGQILRSPYAHARIRHADGNL